MRGSGPPPSLAGRFGRIAALFTALPLALGAVALALHGVHRALLLALFRAHPGWTTRAAAVPLLASLLVSAVLAAASRFAWRDEDGAPWLRAGRLVAGLWFGAFLLYPGLASWVPVARGLPWWLLAGGGGAALAALHLWPGARTGGREALLAAAAVALFLGDLAPRPVDFAALAGRPFDGRDVLLLGFDSVSHADTAHLLERWAPSRGRKTLYGAAWTPIAATSPAWRAILSGELPGPDGVLPGAEWPRDHGAWLPRELAARGYRTVMMQDLPETNTFAAGEWVRVPSRQGWQAIFETMAWKILFPLSDAGGRWWVAALGGPADSAARYAYRPEWFLHSALEEMARAARGGPLLWASHSCYLHAPMHLSLGEAVRLPGWWRRPPISFEGAGNPFTDQDGEGREQVARVRMESVRSEIASWLEALDRQGAFGSALVVVLSDHGQRAGWVSPEDRQHVQLALFEPGPAAAAAVGAPVSLVDVAATVRERLGLPAMPGPARPLPRSDAAADPGRRVDRLPAPTLEQAHVDLGKVRAEDVGRALRFREDGTYAFTEQFLARAAPATDRLAGMAAGPPGSR